MERTWKKKVDSEKVSLERSPRIEFELTRTPAFQKQRQHDQFIMDVLKPFFSKEHLRHINKIRTHLKLLRLSDMCDITGKFILPNIKDGVNHRKSTYGWMTQPLVKKYLPIWRQACARLQQALHNRRLGHWINKSQSWTWKSNSSGSVLTNETTTYVRKSINGRYKYVLHHQSPSIFPYDADVYMKRDSPKLLGIVLDTIRPQPKTIDPFKPFFEDHSLPLRFEKNCETT